MQTVEQHDSYAAIRAAFPGVKIDGGGMTPLQGRVCFQQERLLYGNRAAHALYVRGAKAHGLPDKVTDFRDLIQVVVALGLIEAAARRGRLVIGRSYNTGWYELAQRLPHSIGPRSVNLAAFNASLDA